MAFDVNYILGNSYAKDHWMKRGIAYIIDIVILFVLFFISANIVSLISDAAGWGAIEGINPFSISIFVGGNAAAIYLNVFLSLVLCTFYLVIFDIRFDGTLGKRLVGLKPVSVDGPMTLQKGIFRNLSKLAAILGGASFGIALLAALIILPLLDLMMALGPSDDPRQKYTDQMAGTTVIRTDIEENVEEMKYVPPEPEPEPVPTESTPESDAEVFVGSGSTDDIDTMPTAKREAVTKFVEFFGLSEARAVNLYDAGYKEIGDFKDAIAEDLVIVDKINPTVARAIIKKMESN